MVMGGYIVRTKCSKIDDFSANLDDFKAENYCMINRNTDNLLVG